MDLNVLKSLDLSGKLITFEGGEGSGKTTQIGLLVKDLESLGIDVLSLREPGGSKIAEEIREVILNKENIGMFSRCETLCFAAARAQLMEEKVLPALKAGKCVILDRFVDSNYVYQGIIKGVGLDKVIEINKFATFDTLPDLTFYVDVSPEVGFARINQNHRDTNKYEMMDMSFHHRVRESYLKLCEMYSDRIVRIDGDASSDDVYQSILNILENRFRPLK